MLLWGQVDDDAIRSLIAAAAVLVVLALARIWLARRRYQLVIPDMNHAGEGSAVVAGVSSLLRQQVRRVFNKPGAPDAASMVDTVGADIAGGVVVLHTRVKDIPRLQVEIMESPRDEISKLTGGIRTVSPESGESLVGALSTVLPAQRGATIQPMMQTREWGDKRQVGLTLDAGPIDHAHHASATFWSTGTPSGANNTAQSDRDQIVGLLRPAAIWIAIYLATGSLPIRYSQGLSFARIFHRKAMRDEIDALRAILAAQLATYEMSLYSAEPLIALGFSDQALDDVERAMRVLKTYFRPHYIAGTIHELRGDALIALKDHLSSVNDAADTALVGSYDSEAARSFDRAQKEFDEALRLLNHSADTAAKRAAELRSDFRVRSLKAALRGSDPSHALDQVRNEEITWADVEQHYNVACLYAVASAVADDLGRDGQELAKWSRTHLNAVIDEDQSFRNVIGSDPDLLLAFKAEELQDIAQRVRGTARPKLPA
jgi:tetratricopeptide (TPR) repeat protein